MKDKLKIAMIGSDWGHNEYRKINNAPGAISTYRLIYPKRFLENYDVDYYGSDLPTLAKGKNIAMFYEEFFLQYDLIIIKVIDDASTASNFLFFSKRHNVPLVVDIDDNIWELKIDQPGYEHYKLGARARKVASALISMASAVFSSTKPLADYIDNRIKQAFNEKKDIYVLPNCVDPDDYPYEKAKLNPMRTVIGWQGSTTHHEDLKVAMPAIGKLMQEYPNLHLELLGGIAEKDVADLFSNIDEKVLKRVKIKAGVYAWDKFPELMSQQAWDIAIAPLTDEPFNHAKSHIKWMEYAMYEIPCVASHVYPYYMPIQDTPTIEDGHTGLIAKEDEWYDCLKSLIDNKVLRETIGKNAKKAVLENWQIKQHVSKWQDAIERVMKKGT